MNTSALRLIPAICAILIALLLTVGRPSGVSDLSLGVCTGVLLGLSILALVKRKRAC
jgi:hypothetical protein